MAKVRPLISNASRARLLRSLGWMRPARKIKKSPINPVHPEICRLQVTSSPFSPLDPARSGVARDRYAPAVVRVTADPAGRR